MNPTTLHAQIAEVERELKEAQNRTKQLKKLLRNLVKALIQAQELEKG